MLKYTSKAKRLSGKQLCEELNISYYYAYSTWSNNNKEIGSLKANILGAQEIETLLRHQLAEKI